MSYITAALAGLILCLGIVSGWEYAELQKRDAAIAGMQAQDAKASAAFDAAAAEQQKKWDDERSSVEDAYETQIAKSDADTARLRASVSGLQHTIDAYAGGVSGPMPTAAGAACASDGRAQVLGRLLDEGASLVAECAGDASRAADQIRALEALQR